MLIDNKLLPSYKNRGRVSSKPSCICSKGHYLILKFNDVPICLRGLTLEDIVMLRPFVLHTGDFNRRQHAPAMAAYRHLTDMKPLEPEMVISLSSYKLAWTNNPTKRYIPPRSHNVADSVLEPMTYMISPLSSGFVHMIPTRWIQQLTNAPLVGTLCISTTTTQTETTTATTDDTTPKKKSKIFWTTLFFLQYLYIICVLSWTQKKLHVIIFMLFSPLIFLINWGWCDLVS